MNPTKLTYEGQTHTVEEWAVIYGLDAVSFLSDLRHNDFSIEKVIKTPREKRERIIEYNGKRQNLTKWAEELNIPYFCLRSRLNNLHWTVEKAFTKPYGGNKDDK